MPVASRARRRAHRSSGRRPSASAYASPQPGWRAGTTASSAAPTSGTFRYGSAWRMPLEVAAVRPVAFLDGPYAAVPASLVRGHVDLREVEPSDRTPGPAERHLKETHSCRT